jgi:hypothetical protein
MNINTLQRRLVEIEAALDESVKLQSHYAGLLNYYDGGSRLQFRDGKEWRRRLAEIGTSEADPSCNVADALKLPLLFHAGGEWDAARRAEWLRITGTTEATTKVLCDHIRSTLAAIGSPTETESVP